MGPAPGSGQVILLRFLVTAKTYPNPSRRYRETVCTAGITEQGEWVRLYPVPFRYWETQQQYKLYDWVEIPVTKRPRGSDKRKENYQPAGSPTIVDHVDTSRNWRERKRIVLPHSTSSVEALAAAYRRDGTSLGLIRPRAVCDVEVEHDESDWTASQRRSQDQLDLFGRRPKRLEKPRHWFHYRFLCHDARCRGHRMLILDWGLYELYRRVRARGGEALAAHKARARCWELVAHDKDAYLFLGKHHRFPGFMAIGIFYPKKEPPDERIPLPFR